MIIKEEKTIKQKVATEIVCDICGRKDKIDDWEAQEYVKIYHECGYNSIFPDGDKFDLDICQHCFRDWLKSTGILQEIYPSGE